jgi:putative oxidoreductase
MDMTLGEGLLVAARVLAGGAFLIIGIRNIPNHKTIADLFRANGFPMAGLLVIFGIAMQIGFGALMISGFFSAMAALGLAVFTVLATLMAHSFWTFKPPERPAQVNAFLANTIVTGGLLALAAAGL